MKYYPLLYRLDGHDAFLIWSTDLDGDAADAVVVDANECLLSFADVDAALRFARRSGCDIVIDETPKLHDIDAAVEWSRNPVATSSDCENALDIWNLFGDVVTALPARSEQLAMLIERSVRVYEMLFYGSNLAAITPSGEHYTPNWAPEDVADLQAVFSSGTALFRSQLSHHNLA